MRKVRSTGDRRGRRARATGMLCGMGAGLASLLGCVTTHTIPPEELPAALKQAGQDQRRIVRGEDGKATELPSPAHLRTVEIRTRAGAQIFEAPVLAKLTGDSLLVEGEGASATYPLSSVDSVRLRHDDHKADMIGGTVMLSVGLTAMVGAAAIVAWDFGVYKSTCTDECLVGVGSAMLGAPIGGAGLLLAIPGAILTARGVRGLGAPPAEQRGVSPSPQVSVGPGSAVVTVPF